MPVDKYRNKEYGVRKMKNLIRQFEVESHIDVYSLGKDRDKWEAVLEKFAELIVQECAALAKSKSEYIQSMLTDDRGDKRQIQSLAWQFEEFGYQIKKHFGVEE